METIDPKHKELLDKAFEKLSVDGPYEIKPTNISLGARDKLKPVFIECFTRYDKTITEQHPLMWLKEYDKVLDWMADNQGKGLFLYGDCGRGKSKIILGVLRPVFIALGKQLPGFHASMLTAKSIFEPDEWNFQKYRKWKFSYIDELGTESAVNNYGEKFEAFNEIINMAEERLDILIMSSNLSPEQFMHRYGDRSMDRINRLCKMIEFNGNSLRP
jgi:DNA replication protein DnaC